MARGKKILLFIINFNYLFDSEYYVRLIYKITGRIKNEQGKPLPKLFVEAFDSDFGTSDDYLGNTTTDSNGVFEIVFDTQAFKEAYEILERRPDIYVVVRNSYGIVYKSEIRVQAGDAEVFDITIKDTRTFDDPYANSFQREVGSFNTIGDTIDISQIDPQRSIIQMIRALTSWSYYTQPKILELCGYPGPQVPRYPKQFEHDHSLPWNPKGH